MKFIWQPYLYPLVQDTCLHVKGPPFGLQRGGLRKVQRKIVQNLSGGLELELSGVTSASVEWIYLE